MDQTSEVQDTVVKRSVSGKDSASPYRTNELLADILKELKRLNINSKKSDNRLRRIESEVARIGRIM